jgi:hypothetical protein
MPTALPPGVGDTAGGPTVAQAVSDLDPAGYRTASSMPIGAQAGGQVAPVVPGQPSELPVGQPSALIPDAPIPQNPIGEDPDSYQAVMAILKGSPLA